MPLLVVALLALAPSPASAQPRTGGPVLAEPVPAATSGPVRSDARPQPRAATAAIDTTDRAAVAAAYRDVYLPALAVHAPAPSPQDVGACVAGTTSTALQDATLRLVNYFRGMSQVPSVTFDPALSAKAQRAALMMYANDDLSHYPPTTWKCYSEDGANAAGQSNLGLGFAGAEVVDAYMQDSDSLNTQAGHRWWLQRPAARVMGNGTVGTANALWVLPSGGEVPTATPAFTSWPSAGYFPAPLDPAGRWSFSPTGQGVDLSAASVGVTRNGVPVAISPYPVTSYNSLVFEVGQLIAPTGDAVTSYDVTVSGVKVAGQAVGPYRYSVKMVDPSYVAPSSPPPLPPLTAVTPAAVQGQAVVGSTLTAVAPGWNQTGVTTGFQWLRDANVLAGATETTYRLATADIGHRISVRATGVTAGDRAVSTSTQTATVTKVRSTLSLTASSPAVSRIRITVGLSANGAGLGGAVKVLDGTKTVARALRVVDGNAVYSAKAKPGRHRYTVSYGGTTQVTSAKAAVAATVRDKVAAHLSVSGKSSAPNNVTFGITVVASGQASLGGSVRISRGSRTVVKKLVIRDGAARYTARKQPKGKHQYTVTYSGTASVRKATVKRTVKVRAIVSYATCDAMDAVYPHGVGKSGATDSTSTTPVTDFLRSNALYAANNGGSGEHDLDRDNDGIACER